MAKAHKNAVFVLGDGCRELSSAATSPAGCIWQQCARQQIAATYHATCRRACCRELPPVQPTAVALQPRNYRKKLPPARLSPCMLPKPTAVHAAATCRQDLPAAHTTVHTAVELPQKATAVALPPACLPPGNLPPGHTTLLWVPRPAGG